MRKFISPHCARCGNTMQIVHVNGAEIPYCSCGKVGKHWVAGACFEKGWLGNYAPKR